MGGKGGDAGGDQHPNSGDGDDRNPDLLQDLYPQRRAAVEQNVAGAEQQDDLVQRRIRFDLDEVQRLWTDRDSGDQKHRDVRDPDLLRQQRRDRADRQNETEREQRMLGDLKGGRRVQWATSFWPKMRAV